MKVGLDGAGCYMLQPAAVIVSGRCVNLNVGSFRVQTVRRETMHGSPKETKQRQQERGTLWSSDREKGVVNAEMVEWQRLPSAERFSTTPVPARER